MSHKSSHPDHKIGGVVVKRNRIVSVGFNKYKTHTKSNHPFKNIHCELDCILSANKQDLVGATIYLYRETKQGVPAISRPCSYCMQLLIETGIKTIMYSNDGSYSQETLK